MDRKEPDRERLPPISVAVNQEELDLIKEESEAAHLPVSTLLKSIAIPELKRRRILRQRAGAA